MSSKITSSWGQPTNSYTLCVASGPCIKGEGSNRAASDGSENRDLKIAKKVFTGKHNGKIGDSS